MRKIKEVSHMQYDDWQFLDPETIEQMENYLMHGADPEVEGDPEHFLNEDEYPNEKLHQILEEMLALLGRIQSATVTNKDAILTGQYVSVKDQVPIDEQVTPGEPPSEQAEGG